MTETIRSIRVGDADITIFNVGDIYLPLAGHMNVPSSELDASDDMRKFARQTTIPIHSIHVRLPGLSLMVDAGSYDMVAGSEYQLEGYTPPPPLVEQLHARDIDTREIDHVIITHRHWDHFNATTFENRGVYHPTFPNARHYLNQRDWDHLSEVLQDPQSIEARTLGVLHQAGRLELLQRNKELDVRVRIIAAPGETAGHQIVRIHSAGETFYATGDMYHHPIEFSRPEWMVSWADPETNAASRRTFTAAATTEDALIVGTHIRPIGRLAQTKAAVAWNNV